MSEIVVAPIMQYTDAQINETILYRKATLEGVSGVYILHPDENTPVHFAYDVLTENELNLDELTKVDKDEMNSEISKRENFTNIYNRELSTYRYALQQIREKPFNESLTITEESIDRPSERDFRNEDDRVDYVAYANAMVAYQNKLDEISKRVTEIRESDEIVVTVADIYKNYRSRYRYSALLENFVFKTIDDEYQISKYVPVKYSNNYENHTIVFLRLEGNLPIEFVELPFNQQMKAIRNDGVVKITVDDSYGKCDIDYVCMGNTLKLSIHNGENISVVIENRSNYNGSFEEYIKWYEAISTFNQLVFQFNFDEPMYIDNLNLLARN